MYERQGGAFSREFWNYLFISAGLQYKPAALGM